MVLKAVILSHINLHATFKSNLLARADKHCLSNLITKFNGLSATECNLVCSHQQEIGGMYTPFSGYGLLVYIGLGYKLSMLSIHSPDYVFTVLVSIFICKTTIVRVIEYSASITHACALQMVRTTYN